MPRICWTRSIWVALPSSTWPSAGAPAHMRGKGECARRARHGSSSKPSPSHRRASTLSRRAASFHHPISSCPASLGQGSWRESRSGVAPAAAGASRTPSGVPTAARGVNSRARRMVRSTRARARETANWVVLRPGSGSGCRMFAVEVWGGVHGVPHGGRPDRLHQQSAESHLPIGLRWRRGGRSGRRRPRRALRGAP